MRQQLLLLLLLNACPIAPSGRSVRRLLSALQAPPPRCRSRVEVAAGRARHYRTPLLRRNLDEEGGMLDIIHAMHNGCWQVQSGRLLPLRASRFDCPACAAAGEGGWVELFKSRGGAAR